MTILFLRASSTTGGIIKYDKQFSCLDLHTKSRPHGSLFFMLCRTVTASFIWHLNHQFPQSISTSGNYYPKLFARNNRTQNQYLKKKNSTKNGEIFISKTNLSFIIFPTFQAWHKGLDCICRHGEAEHISVNFRVLFLIWIWHQLNTLTCTLGKDLQNWLLSPAMHLKIHD